MLSTSRALALASFGALVLGCGGASTTHDAATMDASGDAGTGGAAGADAGVPSDANRANSGGAPVDAGPSSVRQTMRPLGTNGAPNGYFEYLPPGYDAQAPTPLLVFWHGIGEDGNGTTDLGKVTAWGPPKLIANNKWDAARPFIVLSPQYTPANGNIAAGRLAVHPRQDDRRRSSRGRSATTRSTRSASF